MIAPWEFVQDLFNPNLGFLLRALAAVVISSVVCGVVGCHAVSYTHLTLPTTPYV